MKVKATRIHPVFLIAVSLCFVLSCDNTVDFQEERETDYYSIYGLLSITDPNSFIRVHDNRIPIDAVTEDNLNVNVTLRNTNTGETELLERQITTFEGAVTHNFMTSDSIKFDTEYVIALKDETGYRDSVRVLTPRKTYTYFFEYDLTDCTNILLHITVGPVAKSRGEYLDYFVEFDWKGRTFQARDVVFPEAEATDPDRQEYQIIDIYYNIQSLLREGLGTDEFSCFDVPVIDYRFEYTHYGREPEEGIQLVNEDGSIELPFFGKRVLGAYTGGFEFSVSDTAFDYDYWFPPQKK
ncbi:MAG: hypothetical protein ED557_08830 [Balneola sp.]|nr:MAG: hypothetical protein ED557_08830 [Balneola sp.]